MKRLKQEPLLLMIPVILIVFYIIIRSSNIDTQPFIDCLAIFTAVAFFFEYHQNGKLNEAQFIIDLNNQFINEGNIAAVEHDLEMYFTHPHEREKYKAEFLEKYALEKPEHQDFINYLVHLEGMAALVNDGVLRLSAIKDLMSYRYFIAVNNPVVQEFELIPYQAYYQGIIKLYPTWAEEADDIPMKETRLDKAIDDQKQRGTT